MLSLTTAILSKLGQSDTLLLESGEFLKNLFSMLTKPFLVNLQEPNNYQQTLSI